MEDACIVQMTMFDHDSLMTELESVRNEILTPLSNPIRLLDIKQGKLVEETDPILLRTPDSEGYYLQLEKRLSYIIPAKGEGKLGRFGRMNAFYAISLMDCIYYVS